MLKLWLVLLSVMNCSVKELNEILLKTETFRRTNKWKGPRLKVVKMCVGF